MSPARRFVYVQRSQLAVAASGARPNCCGVQDSSDVLELGQQLAAQLTTLSTSQEHADAKDPSDRTHRGGRLGTARQSRITKSCFEARPLTAWSAALRARRPEGLVPGEPVKLLAGISWVAFGEDTVRGGSELPWGRTVQPIRTSLAVLDRVNLQVAGARGRSYAEFNLCPEAGIRLMRWPLREDAR